jgi:hypothetical protein
MIKIPIYIFLPSALLFISFPAFFITLALIKRKKRGKRNPLCKDILRGPGESLRVKVRELDDKINDSLLLLYFSPVTIIGFYFMMLYLQGRQFTYSGIFIYGITILFALTFFSVKLFKLLHERIAYRLGLDAELAVGRELNHLMLNGFHVYHDFPEDKNNIDHIVVGSSGVFAIETKGKSKPDKGRGSADAKVVYDGQKLIFPDNKTNTEFISQAKKQAASLSKWLSSAIGESVTVKPVLALPGWFVERKKTDFTILFGYKKDYLKALQGRIVLSQNQITRIVHQLEAKCRDVTPKAYQK